MKNKRKYKGSLRLDWINKDLSLYYEIDEKEGKGVRPVWVPKNDIRVAEPRILKFQKSCGDATSENMLIKGDNLLILRSLVEMFKGRPDKKKVKCVYIDPPFNTGNAFKYYDDNLEHSEWLTMMRDRLFLLRKLLRNDGAIFVHINSEEVHYLRLLLDEVFGRKNFLQIVTIESATTASYRSINLCPVNVVEYLLIYAKEKNKFEGNIVYVEDSYSDDYGYCIENFKNAYEKWKIVTLDSIIYKQNKIKNWREAKEKWGQNWKEIRTQWKADFALQNAEKVVSLNTLQKPSAGIQRIIDKSKKRRNKVFKFEREKGEPIYTYNGRTLAFYKSKIRNVNGKEVPSRILTNIWNDISYLGIGPEGGVTFLNGKKPEALIKRVIELSTNEGDFVFDSFAGSGTTGSVAHKMKRRWIMIEMGSQADDLIIPRLQKIISGKDQSGVSGAVEWKKGGGYKYYQLGESVIYEQDMNWTLKEEEMAEAVFLHFQYKPIEAKWIEKESMYLGRHQSARYHFAISFASRKVKTLTADLYEKVIKELEKEKFKHLTIFTNVAISVPPESLDDRVLVKKIPAAILREYNLL